MSALGNLITDIGVAAGDEGKNTVTSLVKNPTLQGYLDSSTADYGKTRTASATALDQYIKDYLAGGKTATARSGQEQSEIDRYYNGDVERQLASLRARSMGVRDQALARSMDYMRRNSSANRIGGFGGSSSYDRQLGIKQGADMSLEAMLANLGQERTDTDYLNRSKLALTGQRTALADALAARNLVPSQAMKGELGWNLDALKNMIALDQANKFYGIKYEPSASEMAGNITGDVASLAMSIYSGGATDMMGGMMGGGGGGGGSKQRGPTTSWMPSTYTGNSGGGMDQWGSPSGGGWGYGSPMQPYDYEAMAPMSNFDMSGAGASASGGSYDPMGWWGGGGF